MIKPIGNLKVLNKEPILVMDHYDLSKIQHIVDVAPQEAQWFCRVNRMVSNDIIIYKIYEMYIPEQYCSAAEVDTSPEMMVKFYQDLKKEHGDDTNEIMSNMTVWCHSHHNMGVNPSGQDTKQFKEQISMASKADVKCPQIMMIFNKKDQYYCRIWDPESNLMFENPDMHITGYDFKEITAQAKAKFKKKTVKTSFMKTPYKKGNKTVKGNRQTSFLETSWGSSEPFFMDNYQSSVTPAFSGSKKK